ncbi:MAG: hypothetical protein R3C51_04620 [Parvularculaceae bacterium]
MMLTAPASAVEYNDHDRNYVINISDDEDLLEKLIALDAEGIEDLRAEIAEAKQDIADAMDDIDEVRAEAGEAPGGRLVLRIAFAVARGVTESAVEEALSEVRAELDDAERKLPTMDISDDEKVETQYAIDMLRSELDGLEDSLDDLVNAMRA